MKCDFDLLSVILARRVVISKIISVNYGDFDKSNQYTQKVGLDQHITWYDSIFWQKSQDATMFIEYHGLLIFFCWKLSFI
jgi:hypothetical protein